MSAPHPTPWLGRLAWFGILSLNEAGNVSNRGQGRAGILKADEVSRPVSAEGKIGAGPVSGRGDPNQVCSETPPLGHYSRSPAGRAHALSIVNSKG